MKNRVKIYRAEFEWTQSELAERVGVSRQTVHAIEKGNYIPSAVLAMKISACFEIAVEEVFQLEEMDWD